MQEYMTNNPDGELPCETKDCKGKLHFLRMGNDTPPTRIYQCPKCKALYYMFAKAPQAEDK